MVKRRRSSRVRSRLISTEQNTLMRLTARERQIVTLLLQGCSNKDIASRLSVTDRTIKNQLSTLYRKTNVRSRLGLVALVLRSGL